LVLVETAHPRHLLLDLMDLLQYSTLSHLLAEVVVELKHQ
jgi:hypothetical protein